MAKALTSSASQSPGRLLVADPEGDIVLFPCAPMPERFREATAEEVRSWWTGTLSLCTDQYSSAREHPAQKPLPQKPLPQMPLPQKPSLQEAA